LRGDASKKCVSSKVHTLCFRSSGVEAGRS
jgi:hypothetical protein